MTIFHDVEQRSDDWGRLRLGVATSSQFDKIITAAGKESKQWEGFAHTLLAERILGRGVDTYVSPWMERGIMLESDAVGFYEAVKNVETQNGGFFTDDKGTIGCSPDRRIGEDGLLEIKVPSPGTHVGYLLGGTLSRDYYPQTQGQLLVTGRDWVDIVSYHPEMRPAIIRMYRDEDYLKSMETLLLRFIAYVEEKLPLLKA